jgi:hypothetical protein
MKPPYTMASFVTPLFTHAMKTNIENVVLVRQVGRRRLTWENTIQMDLSKTGCEGLFVFLIELAQYSVQRWVFLNVGYNF